MHNGINSVIVCLLRLSIIIIFYMQNLSFIGNDGISAEELFFFLVNQSSKYLLTFLSHLCLQIANAKFVQLTLPMTCCATQVVNFWLKFTISPTIGHTRTQENLKL